MTETDVIGTNSELLLMPGLHVCVGNIEGGVWANTLITTKPQT